MKIFLAQQNYHIGNFELNTQKIISAIEEAKKQQADLAVFSELSVCGYPPRDFLEFDDFINKCYQAIDTIKSHSDKIAVIVGSPQRNPKQEGKDLFNAAWFLHEGEVKATIHKTLLPTYDVFDEYRYFEPGFEWKLIPFKGHQIALTICEDIWNLGDAPLYRICPMDILVKYKPDLMVNISASPFDYDHKEERNEIIRRNVLKYHLPIVYCNAVGSQTEIVFDGGSLAYDVTGKPVKELKYFEEDYAVIDFDELISAGSAEFAVEYLQSPPGKRQSTFASQQSVPKTVGSNRLPDGMGSDGENELKSPVFDKEMRVSRIEDPEKIIGYLTAENNIREIHDALVLGIRDYFIKMGFTKAILGSSGGIDSAVTLALACEALGKENVTAVLMPSQYSSAHSLSDAEQLSKNLENPYNIIAIKDIYDSFLKSLKPVFRDLPFGIAEENIQSRVRGNTLMAIANKFSYILLNTSNKSELATGYGTLYGDMAGGLSVLGDVYKMQVYALAKFINRNHEIIPLAIIKKPPSAELRPNQKDSDSLPEYPLLDKVLYQYIEKRQGPKEIIALGIEEKLVKRILRLVNTNEYKRNQFCPIIRVSSKAFGIGRRVPIVGKYLG
jgi:NAD+ synthase (glutamine-hydrolysing)